MRQRAASVLLWLGLSYGCADGQPFAGPTPLPDGQQFVTAIYPMLLRDCAFVACHGGPERFFQVYGPGRVRLDPQTLPGDPPTLAETLHSYERARSMLTSADEVTASLLISKPLESNAGGQGHKGVDDFGRNIFASTNDASYKQLLAWAKSNGAPPTAAQLEAAFQAASAGAAP